MTAAPENLQRVPFSDLRALHRDLVPALDQAWRSTLEDGQFVGGSGVEEFEAAWADYCGRRYAIGVANGTDALVLALMAHGIGPGDEVLVPANTFIATAEAVVIAGATPVFVDVDGEALLVTPDTLDPALTSRTAAVIAVHLFGHLVDMDALNEWAQRHSLLVIEDAAQAHGGRWRGQVAGSMSAAGCFSFYPGKNLGAMGDGGAVVTDDPAVASRIRSLANHGRAEGDRFRHSRRGMNSRLDGLQARLLSVKLAYLDQWTSRRRALATSYRDMLGELGSAVVWPQAGAQSAWHLFVVRVPDRDRIRAELGRAGVETGIHYAIPCHRQEAFSDLSTPSLPTSEASANEIISLPFHPYLTDQEMRWVVGALNVAMG